jgi:hypothetical protein
VQSFLDNYLQEDTKSLTIRASPGLTSYQDVVLPSNLMGDLSRKCPKLTRIYLHHCILGGNVFPSRYNLDSLLDGYGSTCTYVQRYNDIVITTLVLTKLVLSISKGKKKTARPIIHDQEAEDKEMCPVLSSLSSGIVRVKRGDVCPTVSVKSGATYVQDFD